MFLLLLLFVCTILSVLCLQVAAERGEARRRPIIIINSKSKGNGEPNDNDGRSKSSKCRRGYASSSDDDDGGGSSGYDGYRCVVRQLCSGTVQP